MGINYFTDEQLKELKNNPYVVKCSAKNITYAEEFKDLFWIDYQNKSLNSSAYVMFLAEEFKDLF